MDRTEGILPRRPLHQLRPFKRRLLGAGSYKFFLSAPARVHGMNIEPIEHANAVTRIQSRDRPPFNLGAVPWPGIASHRGTVGLCMLRWGCQVDKRWGKRGRAGAGC